jgi:dTDP-4-amino-4,6-dideoxygalactose transaminase
MFPIRLLVPRMPTADFLLPHLRRIDEKRIYTNFGPLNAEFERRIVAAVAPGRSARNVTTVANGTLGLELTLQSLGLRPQARVLIPSVSFVATATSICRMGMIPVFADVHPLSWCLTPEIAEAATRADRIDAVMPVATFGRPQNTEQWDGFSRRFGIPIVIDAAGAFGNQGTGESTDVVFSFHATKALGAGEGGAVLSTDEERIVTIRRLANFGIDTSVGELRDVGTNGKMSEYHAAVGLASLDQWTKTKSDRVALRTRYMERLRDRCETLSYQDTPGDGIYSVLCVLLPEGFESRTVAHLLGETGIETRRWYCPALHLQPALSAYPKAGPLKIAEQINERLLGLPFFVDMSDEQIAFVCDRLGDVLGSAP